MKIYWSSFRKLGGIKRPIVSREFVVNWHFIDWHLFSFGINLDLVSPNMEIHLPFGFLRIGWVASRHL